MNPEPEITIRRANLADLETLTNIDHVCFAVPLAYEMETFLYYLHDRSSETWVADGAAGVVGFTIFETESRERAHFITLDVLPEHRKKRIGSALMEHAHKRARELGASVMVLQVAVANQVALEFYERRGYIKTRIIKRYYEDNSDAWEMEMSL